MTEHDLPLVGVPACVVAEDGGGDFHKVGEKYIMAVASASRCMPVLIPALGDWYDPHELAGRLDGLMLTGSPSNVEPHRYGGAPSRPGTHHDPVRDATTLPLINAALDLGVPLFAICRGHQELNVALGGTLHQNVHEEDGKDDHRSDKDKSYDDRYRERHAIHVTPGGLLHGMAGGATEVMVNSLHAQAIDRVADRLFVEAISPDGVVEATTVRDARGFALAVQWHPEHPIALEWPLSQAMFRGFGDAARARRSARTRGGGAGARIHAA